MTQTIGNTTFVRRLTLRCAVSGLLAAGLAISCGSAQAAFHGGGGHPAAGHAFGHEGYHGGYRGGYGGWHHGGFERGGRYWHYGPNGVLMEEYGYVPQVVVPTPYIAAPFGVYVP